MAYDIQNMVAKLLAGENLRVEHRRLKTAMFDVKDRILYLPIWENMTLPMIDMLIAHEVGHALYTPVELLDECSFINKQIINVVEDVRVEKLIKAQYPGLRKVFAAGYKELIDNNFFGTKDRDMKKAHVMDKINLWFKVGISAGVSFTKRE